MQSAAFGTHSSLIRARPLDLSPDIESALDALADLESAYEADRERLQQWSAPEAIKEAFLEHLEASHARDRQPFTQRLAYLQRTTTIAKMLGPLGLLH